LLEVVGRLVVEHAREVHERVPLSNFLARDSGDAGLAPGLGEVLRACQNQILLSDRNRGRLAAAAPGESGGEGRHFTGTTKRAPPSPDSKLLSCNPMSSRDAREPARASNGLHRDREEAQRREMVSRYVATRGVDDPRVLAVMSEIPRHRFV